MIILEVKSATEGVTLDEGMDTRDTNVLDTKIVVGAATDFDLITVDLATKRIVKVNHMKILLPVIVWHVPLRMNVALL